MLREFVRRVLLESFVSHTYEPVSGDSVVNTNPNCTHYGSEGVVVLVKSLPKDMGKSVSYECTNDGPTWDPGDVLTKTMDQLGPI
tara:strand:+ start:168 stop:422 length:255 start_codon:yes stop_codon:yes gene_type:complete